MSQTTPRTGGYGPELAASLPLLLAEASCGVFRSVKQTRTNPPVLVPLAPATVDFASAAYTLTAEEVPAFSWIVFLYLAATSAAPGAGFQWQPVLNGSTQAPRILQTQSDGAGGGIYQSLQMWWGMPGINSPPPIVGANSFSLRAYSITPGNLVTIGGDSFSWIVRLEGAPAYSSV